MSEPIDHSKIVQVLKNIYRRDITPCGDGGFGHVFLGFQPRLNRRIAIKVITRENTRHYDTECDAVRQFCGKTNLHPNLLAILHADEYTDQDNNPNNSFFYYDMEAADNASVITGNYIPDSLETRIGQPHSKTPLFLHGLVNQLLDGLQELHEHGLAHLDIKPPNILFVASRPKLADYSLVALSNNAKGGTPGYVPRKSINGIDRDLYALAKTIYVLYTGLMPNDFPEFNQELNHSLFAHKLNQFLLQACSNTPEKRFKNIGDFRQAFNACFPQAHRPMNQFVKIVLNLIILMMLGMAGRYYVNKHFVRVNDRGTSESNAPVFPLEAISVSANNFTPLTRASLGWESEDRDLPEISPTRNFASYVQKLPGWSWKATPGDLFQTAKSLLWQPMKSTQQYNLTEDTLELQLKSHKLPEDFEAAMLLSGDLHNCQLSVTFWDADTNKILLSLDLFLANGEFYNAPHESVKKPSPFLADHRVYKHHDTLTCVIDTQRICVRKLTKAENEALKNAYIGIRMVSHARGNIAVSSFALFDVYVESPES